MLRIPLFIVSVIQGLLTLFAFIVTWPDPESYALACMLAAPAANVLVAIIPIFLRPLAVIAAVANISAIAAFCIMPFVLGGENAEGFGMMAATGLIFVPLGPAAINAFILAWMYRQDTQDNPDF